MATHYLISSKQRNALPTTYLPSQKLDPCPELPHLPDNMMYLNQASNAGSYFKLFSGSSQSHNPVEIPSLGGRDEAVFIMPTGDTVSAQPISHPPNMTAGVPVDDSVIRDSQMLSRTTHHILNGEQKLQNQGLSLSLGMQLPASVNLLSFQYRYTNPGTFSFLSSHVPSSGEHGSQSKVPRNAEYLSLDLAGGIHNMIKVGALNNPQCSISPKEMQSILHLYESSGSACTIFDSKYLRAAQQLLDEVVNVHEALKPPKLDKPYNYHKFGPDGYEETDLKYNCQSMLPSMNEMPSHCHVSTPNSSGKLSPAERQELQSKRARLLFMLDEVHRRYKQYYYQMQILESSFQMVAGCEAAKPYTVLALQTISCHFRCLHDAINRQLRVTQQSLGEQDDTPNGQVLPRLHYVDKKLRQQRTLQQLGVMQCSWRPQRGLPEISISILRAWLFKHFLHPYPKESEKIMLARQTGLTRTQVANWFINARVRLWKPMVEDMYNEDFGDSEAARDKSWALEDGGEELRGSGACMAADGNDTFDCWGMNLQGSQRSKVDDHRVCPEEIMATNLTDDGSLMAAATYDISVSSGFGVDNQMSLTLGLQRSEKDPLPVSGEMHLREDDTLASSVGPDKADGHCMTFVNQYRFGNLHMVHDFVA